uniref:Uncharacterized protein n=1 Tax=Cyprinus carpio TaxID=7962 RepID=A0A8C2FES8_CYPCA
MWEPYPQTLSHLWRLGAPASTIPERRIRQKCTAVPRESGWCLLGNLLAKVEIFSHMHTFLRTVPFSFHGPFSSFHQRNVLAPALQWFSIPVLVNPSSVHLVCISYHFYLTV